MSRFHPQQEFKFNMLSRELRLWFLTAVDPYAFDAEVKIHDSAGDNLLQAADMVAGAVARSRGDEADAAVYRDVIHRHERSLRHWPD